MTPPSNDHDRWSRREVLIGCAASAVTLATAGALRAADVRDDLRITRVVSFDLQSKRNKVAGKNARLDVHGDSAVDPMLRVYASAPGVEGLGVCCASKDDVAKLLGQNPTQFFDPSARRIKSPLGSQNMPLWDLLGRMHDKSVCEL